MAFTTRKTAFHPSGRRSLKLAAHSPKASDEASGSGVCACCLTSLLLLAAVALPFSVLYRAVSSKSLRRSYYQTVVLNQMALNLSEEDHMLIPDFASEIGNLEKILKEASMEDKTVILTTLNAAWASSGSVVDLFMESFRVGIGTRKLLDHMVMVAFDPKAYVRCLNIHLYCFYLATKDVDFSGEKHFMSPGYLDMMWRRIYFLREVLELGYNFIFTDADVMWFRNPLPLFHPDGDIQIACDHFIGNPDDFENKPNGGFVYVKSNNKTVAFYNFWYSSREKYPGLHDQDVLNIIKYDPFISHIGLRFQFLSTEFFGGFCEPSKDLNEVCTMHANCCVGLDRKLHDLRIMLEDWRTFMAFPQKIKRTGTLSWRVPQNCSVP